MRNNDGGMTLVEVMVVTGIVTVIFGAVISALTMGRQSWEAQHGQVVTSMELRRGIDEMTRELVSTRADQLFVGAVPMPANGVWYNTVTFRVPLDVDGNGTVLDAAGTLEWSAQITYSLGGLNGNQVLRTQGGATEVLANGATQLRFRRQAATPQVLSIDTTVQRTGGTGDFTNTGQLNTNVRLRN